MSSIRVLALHHADHITDAAWEAMLASWQELSELSVTHAFCLGDDGLASLGRLPKLMHCFVSGSTLVTADGMHALSDHIEDLEFRACYR